MVFKRHSADRFVERSAPDRFILCLRDPLEPTRCSISRPTMRASAIALVLATAAAIVSSAQPRQANALDDLRRSFVAPPADSRIMMRWWWFGPAVTKPEIERELQAMKAAALVAWKSSRSIPSRSTILAPAFATSRSVRRVHRGAALRRGEGARARTALRSHARQRLAVRRPAGGHEHRPPGSCASSACRRCRRRGAWPRPASARANDSSRRFRQHAISAR